MMARHPGRRSRRPVLFRLVLFSLILALAAGCASTGAQGSGSDGSDATPVAARPLVVTGYALAGSATPAMVERDRSVVDTVGISGVALAGRGRITAVSAQAQALRRAALAAGRSPVLLVTNYSNRIGDFDERLAHRMLSSRKHRRAAAADLARRAVGFAGVQLDLESLKRRDTRGLVRFTRAVRRALPAGKSVSMAFMSSGGARGYAARGYDLGALARVLDVAVLMTYDQHGPWSGAGPIGALPWVRAELRYFLTRVPRHKVDLGAAAYGYQWGGGAEQLTVPQARSLAGSNARWDATNGEWTARLPGGRVLWWDDARSVQLRRELAAREGLHGLAIWEIGSSGGLTP